MLSKMNFLLFTAVILLFATLQISAQRTVTIEPGFGTLGTTIFGDTTATGDRTDPNTIYLLKRDQLYILDGEFSPTFPVTLQAEAGTGARPRIILGVPTGGTTPDQTIRPRADFTIRGIYVSAQDELGGMGTRIIRHEENGIRVVVDDCHLDIASQAAFRVNTDDTKTFMTNTIISNIGSMASPDNGRCFDDRGNDIDTLYIKNCTFYNLTSQVIRDGGGDINYAYFDHNTFNNIAAAGSVGQYSLEFGAANEVVFTNNLVKDGNFLGADDGVGSVVSVMPPTDAGVTQSVIVKNNNIFWTENIISNYPDSVFAPNAFDSLTTAFIEANGDAASNISEFLNFTDGPDVPLNTMLAFWAAIEPFEMDKEGHESFNFAYPTNALSYTAGASGEPLGSLNWFPGVTDVNDVETLPIAYELFNNYPNPFNPTTTIKYSIPEQSNVVLSIYNTLGQEVVTLINTTQNAGTYNFTWNGKNSAGVSVSSGIYMYHLKAGNFISTKKMVMLK
ncbi:MAG: T9SS type A sorting domain-containing protein [Bacteroidetes bacterium]|nr:T9SS type A sorting domain-containing protein [Bacteroidota bacterium]